MDLRFTELDGAYLGNANLKNTELQHSNLCDADLSGTKNLKIEQLAGADLTNARIPEDILDSKNLDYLKSAINRTSTLFLWCLGFYAFCLFTTLSVSDVGLLVHRELGKVPYIQMATSYSLFFIAAPFILLLVYMYFNQYLANIWLNLGRFPAFFPDGVSLDDKIHHWLILKFIRSHTTRLKSHFQQRKKLQYRLISSLIWDFPILVMVLMWLRYLSKHDFFISIIHLTVLSFIVSIRYRFYLFAKECSEKMQKDKISQKKIILKAFLIFMFSLTVATTVTFSSINGRPWWDLDEHRDQTDDIKPS